ncbi:2-amino-4-hydroxy-6-hydroxymethyldihydropteridine diphosphokinase [Alkalibacillus aidingensis]|uniref:2-amino-4-hydroxy-6- hydroxymethyldihydropteridine diphosphokinase n=1 Tax=Alkalibacillus aidingensis TaxID=2747607 RepID=UPI0016613948|nr:2-amino-4-hydroxy-6-hydroxymethyldihydropteridine diphosphokinase [Alkalibacillus aidingensis]
MVNPVYLALGSNIHPKKTYLQNAIDELTHHHDIDVTNQSSIYQTKPVGYTEQDLFLNMVVELKTNLNPYELLDVCQSIEQKLGREREIRFGPRTIDLDILLFDDQQLQSEQLTIPHPRMTERAFVLIPLNEVSNDIYITNQPIQAYIDKLSEDELEGVVLYE